MTNAVRFLLTFLLWGISMNVLAEEVAYPGDKRLVISVAEKVKRSLNTASFVAVGRFVKPVGDASPQVVGDGKAMQLLEFHVSRRVDGGDAKSMPVVNLKLAVYLPLPSFAQSLTAEKQHALLSMPRNNERSASGKLVVYSEYVDAMRVLLEPILKLKEYQRDFVALPIRAGALDAPYRTVDEVVEFSESYLVFIFKKFPTDQVVTVFPSDIDIYNADDPYVADILRFGR